MTLSPAELRDQFFCILDQVAETGEPVDVIVNGKKLRIVATDERTRTFAFDALTPHPESFSGNLDDVVQMDWSAEWHVEAVDGSEAP